MASKQPIKCTQMFQQIQLRYIFSVALSTLARLCLWSSPHSHVKIRCPIFWDSFSLIFFFFKFNTGHSQISKWDFFLKTNPVWFASQRWAEASWRDADPAAPSQENKQNQNGNIPIYYNNTLKFFDGLLLRQK